MALLFAYIFCHLHYSAGLLMMSTPLMLELLLHCFLLLDSLAEIIKDAEEICI